MTNICGYNFEVDKLYEKNGLGRTGMWIKDNLVYDRLHNNEIENESIVIIKIGYPKKRRFLVAGFYRQWSNTFNNKKCISIPVKAQEERFDKQMNEISSMKDMEKIVLGDFNIDYKILNKCEKDKSNYDKSFSTRINSIKSRLLANNFNQLISVNTRKEKILDHIYTNYPNKIHRSYIEEDSSSDHSFVTIEKKMKFTEDEEEFRITRDWKKIDYVQLNNNFKNSDKYVYLLTDNDPDRIAINLINEIQYNFELMAPIIKIKINKDKKK